VNFAGLGTVTKRNTKTVNAASDSPSNRLAVQGEPGNSEAAALARTALRPTVQAGITATKLLAPSFPEPDLGELIKCLLENVAATAKGDLSRAEAMLVSQAQTLDLLFHKLTRQAVHNIGSYPETVALYMKLALRAQSQCRAVAETLRDEVPSAGGILSTSQHCEWPSTSEQRWRCCAPSLARGRKSESAERTIGGYWQWRTAGRRSDAINSGKPYADGDPGRNRRDHGQQRARRYQAVTHGKAASV